MDDLSSVNRVEIIDNTGRVFSQWDIDKVEAVLQDGNRTLKIFIQANGENKSDE